MFNRKRVASLEADLVYARGQVEWLKATVGELKTDVSRHRQARHDDARTLSHLSQEIATLKAENAALKAVQHKPVGQDNGRFNMQGWANQLVPDDTPEDDGRVSLLDPDFQDLYHDMTGDGPPKTGVGEFIPMFNPMKEDEPDGNEDS